jgi:hypothetical protein
MKNHVWIRHPLPHPFHDREENLTCLVHLMQVQIDLKGNDINGFGLQVDACFWFRLVQFLQLGTEAVCKQLKKRPKKLQNRRLFFSVSQCQILGCVLVFQW